MSTQEQSNFAGWAVVEIMGHNKEIGFVTTEYFGGPALFRVDQPSFPERDYELKRAQWIGETLCPVGTKVRREALPGKTAYVGPSSIFRMTPCTEDTARQAIEQMIPAPIKILSLPERPQITAAAECSCDDLDCQNHPDTGCTRVATGDGTYPGECAACCSYHAAEDLG